MGDVLAPVVLDMEARSPEEALGHYRRVRDEIRRFVEGILGGSPGALVAYLADSSKLSEKDLKALRDIAQRIENLPEDK